MAALIQQDLAALGMQVTVVTLDFPALIERLMHTQDYEACLLGLENVDPDPNAMMNVWLSSSPNHQWNPSEKTPATPWEAEIDHAMELQAASSKIAERVQAIDRVQQIVADQQPFIYLVYPNALVAVSPPTAGHTARRARAKGLLERREPVPPGCAMNGCAMNGEPLIRVALDASYGSKLVLCDIRFELQRGEVLGLVGTSERRQEHAGAVTHGSATLARRIRARRGPAGRRESA